MKTVLVCPACGCPGLVTKNDENPEHARTVWAYECVPDRDEEIRRLNAVIDAGLPRDLADALKAHYDPARGRVMDWCDETRREADD